MLMYIIRLICIYIYIYINRERDVYIYIYIYIYIHTHNVSVIEAGARHGGVPDHQEGGYYNMI